MRIFNKMKKTMLVLAASLFCANVAFAEVKTGSYAVVAGDIASGAQITSVEGITMTFGTSETWTSGTGKVTVDGTAFNVYATTGEDVSPSNGKIPAAGPYVVFTPQFNGTVTGIVSNAGETKNGYIVKDEDDNLVNGTVLIDGADVAWVSGTPYNSAAKYNGGVTFEVEAGSTYYFYMSGSKMRFNGFIYTYDDAPAAAPVLDFTAYDASIEYAKGKLATLDPEADAMLYEAISILIEENEAFKADIIAATGDEAWSQEDVDRYAEDFKATVDGYIAQVEAEKLMAEVDAVREEASALWDSYPEDIRTDNAGLADAMAGLPRNSMGVSAEQVRAAIDAVKAAMEAFKAENDANMAADDAEVVVLTKDMYKVWDGVGVDAQPTTDAAYCEVNFGEGKTFDQGATLYGNGNVSYNQYADLTGYEKIVFEGTPGLTVRLMFNRQLPLEEGAEGYDKNGGAYVEKLPVLDAEGKGEYDLTELDFAHLNAIKIPWNGTTGASITKIALVKAAEGEGSTTINLIAPTEGVNILEAGKTYAFGEQYTMYKVQFTAEKDGFLSIIPSQKVNSTSLKINGASSTFTKVNGGIEKKGMAAGSVFEGTFYCSGTPSADNVYELVVTFEEGTPYSPLALTLANPADGAEWSGAVEYKSYGTKGVPHYEFSSIISADVKASVKIGDKVYENIKLTVDGYNPKLDITALPDTLSKAIAAGLIKAGETFTLTLSNIIDKDFAANTLADLTFTYTLASTACTGAASDASTSNYPSYVTFSFDGNVNIDNAKFYYVNMFTEETVELTAEIVEGTSVKVTVPAVEGLPSRQYKVVAENVTDADGKAISYTNDAIAYPLEEGKLIFTKALNNSVFNNGKTASISVDKWGDGYTQVYSLKSFTVTFPAPVVLDESVTTPIIFTKDEDSNDDGGIDWWAEGDDATGEGSESTETEITVSHAISETDPCTVIFTLSQEVTELGKYSIEVPSKLYWAKDYYTAGDDAKNDDFGYYSTTIYAYAEIIPVPVADGTYYMKNVAADKFMTGGNSWGTRASLGEHGLDVKFTFTANGKYTLDTNVPSSSVAKHYLGSNGFIDSDLTEWILEKQTDGTYLISLDKTNYLGYSEGSTEVNLTLPATAGEAIQWQLITKEELVAGLAEASEENPVDATFFIVGQNFNRADDTRNAAWQGAPAFGGGNNTNFCAEKWNCNFDVYQDLTGLPNGYYTLTAQGFYRAGGGGATATDQHALLYANDVTIPLVNILSEAGNEAITGNVSTPEGYGNVPNNMESAGIAFAAGLYADHSISVKVTEGTLRIGVKKETLIGNDWTIFDNFELTYYGAKNSLDLQVDTLKALVAEANELKASLDATDEAHAQIIGMIDQMIPAAQAVIDAPASIAAVKDMSSSVYMFLFQTKINLAQYDAQNAQALMATYEEPTDEAGLATAINQVFVVSNGLMMNEGSYTLEQLDEAVAAMKVAKDAFIKENTPAISEVSVSLTHTASSYCEGDANAYKSTVDTEKEYVNQSAFSGTWQGAAYAEFSVLLPEGVSIKSATLTWTGIGESRQPRNTDVYYVNAGNALDYEALQGGAAKVNLEATKIESVTFPKGATAVFTTDVTSAVQTIVAAGQNYIIFKFTGNPGGGHLAGKADAANAPVLTLETADASAMTTYTVTYVDEAGAELKTADVYSILIGETATIADENKAAIYNEDKSAKYIYASCDNESIVAVADSASNVITATFREAAKYNYTVETTDDSGSLTITMGSYSGFEGENVVAPYYAYVLNEADSTLYESAKNGKEYNKYVDLTQDNMKVQVAYTPTTIKNVVYYQEAENVEGLTKVTTGNTAIRSSNSASAYAADADVVLTTLAPGKYKLAAVIYDATKGLNSEFSFIAGSDTILKAVSTAANWTNCVSEEFTLTANTAISLAKGGNVSKGVDFVYIQKTGDVELPAKIAYLNTKGDADDAIYDALVAGGYAVDALAYADSTLTAEMIDANLAGYDVVVLGGSTGSSANLAKTANLLLGKVNVLSTKAFWYKHYGANGDNPGSADAPSLGIAKVAGYEEHPIYAGIEGDEFAVFNDMGKENGRYLQSNGSFANGPEQVALGTANGMNSIGEAWVDGYGYIIIPVDGLQPSGYLTADGAQLFVNAVEYLIAGEVYEFNAIEGVQVEGTQWPADIYDLSGRMIKKAATSLEGLEKGLYIVNGKKLLVK